MKDWPILSGWNDGTIKAYRSFVPLGASRYEENAGEYGASDVVSDAAWVGVGGVEKKAAEELLAKKADEAVSAANNCPNVPRDYSNVPGTSWEGRAARPNATDYLDQGWNPRDTPYRYTGATKNGLAGIYASKDLETPLAELIPRFDEIIAQNSGYESYTPISKNVKLENYLDLTDEAVGRRLNLSEKNLLSDDHTLTQQLGAEAYMAGFNGILAPSARNTGGKNIVSFGGL